MIALQSIVLQIMNFLHKKKICDGICSYHFTRTRHYIICLCYPCYAIVHLCKYIFKNTQHCPGNHQELPRAMTSQIKNFETVESEGTIVGEGHFMREDGLNLTKNAIGKEMFNSLLSLPNCSGAKNLYYGRKCFPGQLCRHLGGRGTWLCRGERI
jgi:hypothetical protein